MESSGEAIMVTGPFVGGPVSALIDGKITVDILNIRNPRSIKTSSPFKFESYDSER